MHIIQVVRNYLGLSQLELAKKAGLSQPDLCEMETKEPYGRIDKYQRLSNYLGIPIHALVTNDCTQIPDSFFDKHPHPSYTETVSGRSQELGRGGEDTALFLEKERLKQIHPNLAKLIQPYYKLRYRPGYDILSFDTNGKPIFIEVKTTTEDNPDFVLTKQEYQVASKMTAKGETYQIYRFSNWGKQNQKLDVYDFRDLKEHWDFSPATYLCSSSKAEPVISGITYHREACGMSKGELADYLGIKTPDLWRYENDKRQCPVGVYRKIASILNVTIDQLLEPHMRQRGEQQ